MKNQENNILISYKKAQSLLSRIIKMVENDEYCIDIMQQNLAVIGLLKSAHQRQMENHLNTCFASAMKTNNLQKQKRMTQEILQVTKLFNK